MRQRRRRGRGVPRPSTTTTPSRATPCAPRCSAWGSRHTPRIREMRALSAPRRTWRASLPGCAAPDAWLRADGSRKRIENPPTTMLPTMAPPRMKCGRRNEGLRESIPPVLTGRIGVKWQRKMALSARVRKSDRRRGSLAPTGRAGRVPGAWPRRSGWSRRPEGHAAR